MKDTSFSIVIPTHGRPEVLAATLASILSLEKPGRCELIVIDNAGDPATHRVVGEASEKWTGVRYERLVSGGAAAARNRGAELAGGRWLLFCDDDALPLEPDHLSRHLSVHESHPRALVVGWWNFPPTVENSFKANPFGRFRLSLDERFRREYQGRALDEERFEVAFVSAFNLSIERSLFDEVGAFDPAFPYAGAEDQDLSLRAREGGCMLILDRSIHLHHNDRWLSLSEFCTREERSAQTAVVLARNFPEEAGKRALLTENRPITRGDRPALIAKKIGKRILSRRAPLAGFHLLTEAAERLPIGERLLHRLYRVTIGLHIFRGVRTGLTRTDDG